MVLTKLRVSAPGLTTYVTLASGANHNFTLQGDLAIFGYGEDVKMIHTTDSASTTTFTFERGDILSIIEDVNSLGIMQVKTDFWS